MRKQLGLTQKDLAKLAGVSQSLIAKIESNRIDPAYSKVVQIVVALESQLNQSKKTVGQIMTSQIISIKPSDSVFHAIELMRSKDISQLPVFEGGSCIGSVSDRSVIDLISKNSDSLKSTKVREIMDDAYPSVPPSAYVETVSELMKHYRAVLVEKNGKSIGIVTKADLLKAV
jgi:predicted transcriptional regulator